jgi:metal-dependent amidase/aminoacylase/carboxypeptidase family protein
VRTLDADTADKIQAAVRRILDGLKTGLRLDYELEWRKLVPVLRNDKATLDRVLGVARDVLGPANVVEMPSPDHGQRGLRLVRRAHTGRSPAHRLEDRRHDTAIHRADYQLNEQMIPLAMNVMTRAVLNLMA